MLHARIVRFDVMATVALFKNLVLELNVALDCVRDAITSMLHCIEFGEEHRKVRCTWLLY